MNIILFAMKCFYYFILLSLLIFLSLFAGDDYWNFASALFFGLIGIGYLIKMFTKNISIDQLMKHGLIYFMIGVVVSSTGIFVGGEIFLKLSFLVFMMGIIGSLVNYKNEKI